LIRRHADHGIGTGTGARLTAIGLSTRIAVVAGRAIGLGDWGRAHARARIAGTDQMALIRRCADHGIGTGAHARLTGIRLCAGVVIVAGAAVGLARRGGAEAGARVADSNASAARVRQVERADLYWGVLIGGRAVPEIAMAVAPPGPYRAIHLQRHGMVDACR